MASPTFLPGDPLESVDPLLGLARRPEHMQMFAELSERHLAAQPEHASVMMAGGEMIGDVLRHAAAIVRHEQALFSLAVQQELWVEGVQRRRAHIANAKHIDGRIPSPYGIREKRGPVFVEQEANRHGAVHSCSCARMTACIFSLAVTPPITIGCCSSIRAT